jgi:hypothetical protein
VVAQLLVDLQLGRRMSVGTCYHAVHLLSGLLLPSRWICPLCCSAEWVCGSPVLSTVVPVRFLQSLLPEPNRSVLQQGACSTSQHTPALWGCVPSTHQWSSTFVCGVGVVFWWRPSQAYCFDGKGVWFVCLLHHTLPSAASPAELSGALVNCSCCAAACMRSAGSAGCAHWGALTSCLQEPGCPHAV